jgi:uncharacterized Tic20 family protein
MKIVLSILKIVLVLLIIADVSLWLLTHGEGNDVSLFIELGFGLSVCLLSALLFLVIHFRKKGGV